MLENGNQDPRWGRAQEAHMNYRDEVIPDEEDEENLPKVVRATCTFCGWTEDLNDNEYDDIIECPECGSDKLVFENLVWDNE